jgi:hypothetical protein
MRKRFNVRNPLAYSILGLLVVLAFAPLMFAQTVEQREATKTPSSTPEHGLAGIWSARKPANATMPELIAYFSSFPKGEPAMTPWSETLYKAAKPSFGPRSVTMQETNDPDYKCFPPGVPRVYLYPLPLQIIQLPDQVVMLFEYEHMVRHIYIDGREHPKDLDPTWMGNSIAHWEGDTLVVDTIGFNDKTWLDRVGHAHSDQLHVIERIRRTAQDTLQIDFNIEDPKAYTEPITKTIYFDLKAKWDIMEHVCVDNISSPDKKREDVPAK